MIMQWELQGSMFMLVLLAFTKLLTLKYQFNKKIYLNTMETYRENILLLLIAPSGMMAVYNTLKILRVLAINHGFHSSLETQ
jgi:hypothetical protein